MAVLKLGVFSNVETEGVLKAGVLFEDVFFADVLNVGVLFMDVTRKSTDYDEIRKK